MRKSAAGAQALARSSGLATYIKNAKNAASLDHIPVAHF
jgi:hypothetical protein